MKMEYNVKNIEIIILKSIKLLTFCFDLAF